MSGVPPIPTFTTSEVLTSSDMQEISTALNFTTYNRPVAKAHAAAAITLPSGSLYNVNFEVVDKDTDGGFTGTGSSTSKYVCRTQGTYLIAATVGYAPGTGNRFAVINVNGVAQNGYSSAYTAGGVNVGVNVSGLVHMNVNDYLQISAYQDSGGNLATAVSPSYQACSLSVIFEVGGST